MTPPATRKDSEWRAVKFTGKRLRDVVRLRFLRVLLGTLVDLYLVTADAGERARLRQEIVAHMMLVMLALDRALSPPPAASRLAA